MIVTRSTTDNTLRLKIERATRDPVLTNIKESRMYFDAKGLLIPSSFRSEFGSIKQDIDKLITEAKK